MLNVENWLFYSRHASSILQKCRSENEDPKTKYYASERTGCHLDRSSFFPLELDTPHGGSRMCRHNLESLSDVLPLLLSDRNIHIMYDSWARRPNFAAFKEKSSNWSQTSRGSDLQVCLTTQRSRMSSIPSSSWTL